MLSVFARTSPKTTYLSGGRKSNQKDDVISTAYQDVIFVIFLVRNDSVPVYKCIKYYKLYRGKVQNMHVIVLSPVLCLFWPPKYRHTSRFDNTLAGVKTKNFSWLVKNWSLQGKRVFQIGSTIHSVPVSDIMPINMLISKFSKIFLPKTSLPIPCLRYPLNVKELIGDLSLKDKRFLKLWTIFWHRVSFSFLAHHGSSPHILLLNKSIYYTACSMVSCAVSL